MLSSKLILVFVVILIFFVVLGYFRTVPSSLPEGDTAQVPKIMVEPKVFDFGEVEFGKVVEHTFEVKNIGSKSLEIKRVSTSCACTKAKVGKERLEPGEKTELLVTYDAGAMGRKVIGKRLERFVYIKSNDPVNPQVEVTIYARVK